MLLLNHPVKNMSIQVTVTFGVKAQDIYEIQTDQ